MSKRELMPDVLHIEKNIHGFYDGFSQTQHVPLEKYLRASHIRAVIEGMKEPATAIRIAEYTQGYGDGFNKALDALIENLGV